MDENSIKIIVCGDSYGLFHTDHATQAVIAKNIHRLLIADPLCG